MLLGGGVALAMVAGLALLNGVGSNTGKSASGSRYPISTTASLSFASATLPGAVKSAVKSMVLLSRTTASGTAYTGCGISLGRDGLFLTSAQSVKATTSLVASAQTLAPSPATVVAVDPGSDVALVRVLNASVPVASLSGDRSIAAGSEDSVVALTRGATSHSDPGGVTPRWSPATFDYIGSPPRRGSASSLADIMVTTLGTPQPPGAVLVNGEGSVIGLLDQSVPSTPKAAAPRAPNAAFLPADLLAGVANDLALNRPVKHGWLGIDGRDTTVGSTAQSAERGALVSSVDPNGPAASSLKAGDVIEAVGGHPVRSMAELRTRLYVLSPGTPVQLKVVRDGTTINVEVDLASSP